MSGASERANGRASDPVRQSVFLAVPDHSVVQIFSSDCQIEFEGEEGTGLGPSLEFYSLTAAEFQRKDLKMWLCDDSESLLDDEVPAWGWTDH